MGNSMSAKGFVVSGVLFAGFMGFIIGVPSNQVVYSPQGTQPATYGYFGTCDSVNQYAQTCHSLPLDLYHCTLGETPTKSAYTYDPQFMQTASIWIDRNPAAGSSNFLDVDSCRSTLTAGAFGIMAIVFSFVALLGAILHEKGRMAGGGAGVVAAIFGVISLAVFFAIKPENLNNAGAATSPANPPGNKSLSDFVSSGILSLGYSTGLQVVGIIASFTGGILALVAGDLGPTGGASKARASERAPTHHPQSSVAGEGTEMH